MKRLIQYGNAYAKQSDWRDFALVKFCLCAMGVMMGCAVSPKHKKWVVGGSLVVFLATYIPLMGKFLHIIGQERNAHLARELE